MHAFLQQIPAKQSVISGQHIRMDSKIGLVAAGAAAEDEPAMIEITAEQAAQIIAEDGVQGLFLRGLSTKLLSNGAQAMLFTICWRYFEGKINAYLAVQRENAAKKADRQAWREKGSATSRTLADVLRSDSSLFVVLGLLLCVALPYLSAEPPALVVAPT